MAEYITKKQAVNVINTAFGHVYDSDSTTVCLVDLQNEIVMTLDEYTDSADVVEVTRCRDCKYRHRHPDTEEYWCNKLAGLFSKVDKDEYCSRGERMDGEEE